MAGQLQIAVLGLGRFGRALARSLATAGHEVLAVDRDEAAVQDLVDEVARSVIADITDADALRDLDVDDFDVGVVATSDLEASVLATLNLQSLSVPAIYAKARSDRHATILRRLGAQRVVIPEEDGGKRFSHVVGVSGIQDYLPLTPGYGVGIYTPTAEWIGEPLSKLVGGGKSSRRLLVLVRDQEVQLNPVQSQGIKSGDRIVMAGSDEDLSRAL